MLRAVANRGAAIKAARERAEMNQTDVAVALRVKQAAVSKWETGRALPEAGKLVRLAVLLRCSVEDLVVGVDADYDRQRLTYLGRASSDHRPLPGGSDGAAEARIRELDHKYKAALAASKDVALRLLNYLAKHGQHVPGVDATAGAVQPRARKPVRRARG